MGKKSAPAPPPPPDPRIAIEAQSKADKENLQYSAGLNAVNIYGPTGSTTYGLRDDGTPHSQYTTLSPEQRQLYDLQMAVGGQLGEAAYTRTGQIPSDQFSLEGLSYDPGSYNLDNTLQNFSPTSYPRVLPWGGESGTTSGNASGVGQAAAGGVPGSDGYIPLNYPTSDTSSLPYDPRSYGNIDAFREDVQDAVFEQQARNLRPEFDRQYDRQKQDLANRGLPVGGEAWSAATEELNRNQANAWQAASNQAMAASGAEAQRLMGMEQNLRGTAFGEATTLNQLGNAQNLDRINLEQTLRDRQLQERLLGRTQAFNEASALLQGSPALTMPNTPQMANYRLQSPDIIGAYNQDYQNRMAQYNAQVAQSQGAWQGTGQALGGIASIAAKCARHYKEDDGPAERILDRMDKVAVRSWRYKREIEPQQPLHLSPYAEDIYKAFGVGDGDSIPLVDMIGICWKSIQELKSDVDGLKPKRRAPAKKKPAQKRRATA